MSMVRMFHVVCDAPDHNDDYSHLAAGDLGDEYYASEARAVAKKAGYHMKGDLAICDDCWDDGVRYKDLES